MGIHPTIKERLERERGLAAVWQLRDDGCTRSQIRHAANELRLVHDGVFVSGHAPLTDWQRWRAATLTAPDTWLSDWSGSVLCGFRQRDRWPTTVRRVGDGGPKEFGHRPDRLGALRVSYSERMAGDTGVRDGVPILAPGRILLELIAQVTEKTGRRYMREALRLRCVTPVDLQVQIARHHGRRGIESFRKFTHDYAGLGLERGRSDAEGLAVALLDAAGAVVPAVNVHVGGEEADLVRADWRLIVELDGPHYHQFILEDARKQAVWEQAGYVVRRLPTDAVFDEPHLLLGMATTPVTAEERAIAAATRGPADVIPRLELARNRSNGQMWSL